MNKQAKTRGAVPRLRFPGFAGEWDSSKLGSEGEFLSSLTGKSGEDFGAGNAKFIPYMNVFANTFVDVMNLGVVKVNVEESQNPVQKGDVLFTVSSETPEDAGMSSVLLQDIQNCYVNSFCAVFRFDESKAPNPVFTGYLLRQPATRAYFAAKAQGSTRFNLSKDAFRNVPLFVPKEKEQQKIADCLSSLDASIRAETRQLDALKAHKQGLMQQLFPAEGQRLPRMRFPGFDGGWESTDLGRKTIKVGSGVTPKGGARTYKRTGRPFVRSQNVGWGELLLDDIAFIDEETHASFASTEIVDKDVLLNITGASIGRSAIADGRIAGGNVNQHVCIIRPVAGSLDPVFLNQFLISKLGQSQIDSFQAGGNRQGLNFTQIRSLTIPLPPRFAEQQEVSACLSSLDTLIATQSRKLAALAQHKQGLMQGLFPALDVAAQ